MRALVREFEADAFLTVFLVFFFKNLSLNSFHLGMSFGVSFSGSHHESVHVLINSFLSVTKFFFELVVELILVVGLLIQLFDSSNQNKVGFLLSVEQVHEVSNFDGNLVSTD